jgi:hypothetical protein
MGIKRNVPFDKLFFWHLVAGVAHFVSFVTIYVLVFATGSDWTIPVVVRYALWTRPNEFAKCNADTNPCSIVQRTDVLFDASLGTLVGIFSLLSTFTHAEHVFVILFRRPVGLFNGITNRLKNPLNYSNFERWLEYSLSASVMLVIVAALCGLASLYDMLWVSANTFAVMWFGYAVETARNQRSQVIFYVAACVTHTLVWVPIVIAFELGTNKSDAPPEVKAIVYCMVALFSCFGVVPFFQFRLWEVFRRQGNGYAVLDKDEQMNAQNTRNRQAEYTYIALSLAAKLVLTWLVYAGVFMRDRFGIVAM